MRRGLQSSLRVPARVVALLTGVLAGFAANAADPLRGAALYMRAPGDGRSCVACHGPDPGANPNNILRAADQPATLTKTLNTVSAMGFLRPVLSDADRADIAAFLGTVVNASLPGEPLRLWPSALEAGAVAVTSAAATQHMRLRNMSARDIELSALSVAGSGAVLRHDCGASLPAGQACDLQLEWPAAAPGWSRAAVSVVSPAQARPLVAGASVLGSSEPVAQLRWATGTDPVRFDAGADSVPARRAVTLHNAGPMPVALNDAILAGPQAANFRLEDRCSGRAVLQASTTCDIVIAFDPGRLTYGEATLLLRGDPAMAPPLRLEGTANAKEPPAAPMAGGGCSVGPPGARPDPLLLAALAAAVAAFWRRRSKTV